MCNINIVLKNKLDRKNPYEKPEVDKSGPKHG